MRWDLSGEEHDNSAVSFEGFHQSCSDFLVKAIKSGDWYIWVAEIVKVSVPRFISLWNNGQKKMMSSFLYFGLVVTVCSFIQEMASLDVKKQWKKNVKMYIIRFNFKNEKWCMFVSPVMAQTNHVWRQEHYLINCRENRGFFLWDRQILMTGS
ncbi:hypothetical protein [Paenibacillus alginolyticus]|uniref:hypothetical protein n=1 Tax=Paenibacillus alginolyticus TaxID=59839 RepID=UPI001FE950AB|nr:hypothetical protein [Paenibacillus frigoriresistens]